MESRPQRVVVGEGVSLHVNVWSGTGQPPGGRTFVLVHGLASNARMWDGVAAQLCQRGHEVATVDLRGHGRSDKPDAGYDFTTVSSDVARVIDTLGFERPVVAGQSWGGNVVLELAARRPGYLGGLALVDGGWIELSRRFGSWEECRDALTPPATTGIPKGRLEAQVRAMHPDWPDSGIAGLLANFEVRGDGTVAPWLTLERHLLILRQLWGHRPAERYAAVEEAVLLVAAGSSDVWSGAVRAAERQLRRVQTVAMAGDHDLHAQHPVALAELFHGLLADGFFS